MIDRRTFSVSQYLDDANQNMEDLKYSQPLGGASFVNYPVSSGATNDASVTVPAGGYRAIEITFTHDEPNTYNIVTVSHFLRVDNSNVMASPYTPTTSGIINTRLVTEAPQHGITKWIIDVYNADVSSHTVYFKLFFSGTVGGTFSVAAL